MRRLVPLVVAAGLLSSACTMTPQGRTGTIVGGVAMGALGVVAMSQGPVDADNNGVNEWVLDDNLGAYMLGSMLITGGIGLLIAGLTAREEPTPPQVAVDPRVASSGLTSSQASVGFATSQATGFAPATSQATGFAPSQAPVGFAAPTSASQAFAPPGAVELEADPARLPELPATAEVLRMAKQVRLATAHGRCDHAWAMWKQLSELDASYARALRDGPVMARCPVGTSGSLTVR